MYRNKKISLIIPCFNEERGIAKILESKPKFIDEVVVVDNNSTDKTAEVSQRLGARVVSENKNGYGYAYLAGFKAATGDVVVAMDGDNSYPISETATLLDFLFNKNLDFISGCRFPLKNKFSMRFLNRLGNFLLTLIFNFLTLKRIRDSQSGMWVFKKDILSKMNLKGNGMALSEEIKMEAILNKEIKFGERLIIYSDRVGRVKLRKWKDGFKNLLFLFKKRLEIFLRRK
jgi:glycosyltransferase involved in cell wall biosynthesis